MVILQNISRTHQTIILDHHSFRDVEEKDGGHRRTKRVTVAHAPNGKLTARIREVAMPNSITLLAGQKSGELPDEVLKCTAVARMIDKKILRPVKQTPAAKVEDKKPSPPQAPTKGKV